MRGLPRLWHRGPVVVAILLAACAPGDSDPAVGAEAPGVPEAFAPIPDMAIGEGSSAVELFQVITPFLMDDGRLVIPERTGHIRVFSAEGELIETFGGVGAGPGEFRAIRGAWARGDTIEAHDWQLRRMTRFLPDGSAELIDLREGPFVEPVAGSLPGGWAFTQIRGGAASGRDDMAIVWISREGEFLGEVAEIEGMKRESVPGASGPGPLSPQGRFGVGGGRIHLAETWSPVIRRLGAEGVPEGEVRWDPGPAPSPQEARQAVMDSIAARADPEERSALMERMSAFPTDDHVPAFWDFRVDPEGFYWIQPFEPGRHSMALSWVGGARTGGVWWIVAENGTRVGSIEVPESFRIAQITRDAVVGVHQDGLGVESVRVYALRRTGD